MTARITYWKEADGRYLGFLNDYPDHWTEGLNGLDAGEGLLGEATACGGFYTFAASITLLPGVLFVAARTTEMS